MSVLLIGACGGAQRSSKPSVTSKPVVAKAEVPKPTPSVVVAAPEASAKLNGLSSAVASDIPGKSVQPHDPDDQQPGERIAVAFKPSPRAIREKRVTVGVGDKRPRADICLVYPAGSAVNAGVDPISGRVASWLGPRSEYRVVAPGAADFPSPIPPSAEWVAVFDVSSTAAATANYVAIEGRHFPLTLQAHAEPLTPVPHADSAAAREALSVLGKDPLQFWRSALAGPMSLEVSDPVLAPLARRRAVDARAALQRLEPDLAASVRLRMAGVVDLGEGVALPIWPGDSSAARTLIHDLLGTKELPRRTLMAQAWLAQQPVAGAVVLDDAAAVDFKSGLTFPSVLLANFTDAPLAASTSRTSGAGGAQPEMLRIEPMTAITATVGAELAVAAAGDPNAPPVDPRRADRRPRTVAEVRIGDWRAERSVVGEIAKCRPPGLTIGPLMADWTQATFLTAAMDPSANAPMPASVSNLSLAGRLLFEGGRWVVYFELAAPADPKAAPSEIVLYFGPRGASAGVALRVQPDGSLFAVRSGVSQPAGKATIAKANDRTSIWVPVPSAAIEGGKVLRIGLVFVDEQGRRSAWPRPMLPWHTEPGRVAVDLGAWGPAAR